MAKLGTLLLMALLSIPSWASRPYDFWVVSYNNLMVGRWSQFRRSLETPLRPYYDDASLGDLVARFADSRGHNEFSWIESQTPSATDPIFVLTRTASLSSHPEILRTWTVQIRCGQTCLILDISHQDSPW